MTDPRETTFAMQDEFLDALQKSQEAAVHAMQKWNDFVASALPAFSANRGVGWVPTPLEVVDSTFAFMAKLMSQQHQFARRILAPGEERTGEEKSRLSDLKDTIKHTMGKE